MEWRFGLAIFLSLVLQVCVAQHKQRYWVKPGEITAQKIPFADAYRFPDFHEGSLQLINGRVYPAVLNYNLLLREIQMLNNAGDTVPVNPLIIRKAVIAGVEFRSQYQQNYIEVLSGTEELRLGVERYIGLVKTNVFGEQYRDGVSPINDVEEGRYPTYREVYTNRSRYSLLLSKQQKYYFVDKNQRIYPARSRVLRKLFPQHSTEIFNFMRDNDLKLKKEEDLMRLIASWDQLTQH